jgi:hypothetical protein
LAAIECCFNRRRRFFEALPEDGSALDLFMARVYKLDWPGLAFLGECKRDLES